MTDDNTSDSNHLSRSNCESPYIKTRVCCHLQMPWLYLLLVHSSSHKKKGDLKYPKLSLDAMIANSV